MVATAAADILVPSHYYDGEVTHMMTSSNGITGPLIHRSPVNSPPKGQWHGALMFSLFWAWKNAWVNNLGTGNLRRHRGHYDVTVMNLFQDWITAYETRGTQSSNEVRWHKLIKGYQDRSPCSDRQGDILHTEPRWPWPCWRSSTTFPEDTEEIFFINVILLAFVDIVLGMVLDKIEDKAITTLSTSAIL